MEGIFMLGSERNESFSAESLPTDDPFSPKALRLLLVIAEAIFTEPPADSAARQDNDELVASFAQLFFPGLPEEQARSQLALMVAALLEEAAEEEQGICNGDGLAADCILSQLVQSPPYHRPRRDHPAIGTNQVEPDASRAVHAMVWPVADRTPMAKKEPATASRMPESATHHQAITRRPVLRSRRIAAVQASKSPSMRRPFE
jgi:hypothetical protein